jgi:hypothetical protein
MPRRSGRQRRVLLAQSVSAIVDVGRANQAAAPIKDYRRCDVAGPCFAHFVADGFYTRFVSAFLLAFGVGKRPT